MTRKLGLMMLATGAVALVLAIADDAQARRGGSFGSNGGSFGGNGGSFGSNGGSWGSNGGSHGSVGGRFFRRNNGSYGSNGGSYNGCGSCGGSYNGHHENGHHENGHQEAPAAPEESSNGEGERHEAGYRGERVHDSNQPMPAPELNEGRNNSDARGHDRQEASRDNDQRANADQRSQDNEQRASSAQESKDSADKAQERNESKSENSNDASSEQQKQ